MFAAKDSLLTRPSGGYQISRSLRFNSADSAYLNRTPASAGNRNTWTWSGWIKRSSFSANSSIFSAYTDVNNRDIFQFDSETLQYVNISGGSANMNLNTTQLFRDVSAWYHILLVADTTQATSSNRLKMYVNGSQITAFITATYPAQNANTMINNNVANYIAREVNSGQYANQYMTEINFIDGQALTPSSFGSTNADTGVWQPKAFSGTYGTNGFYLNFSDNSNTTAATLGKDYSGNGNNWTPNNFSVTAGAGNDSLVDSPTSYGTDTGVGGNVRGNYATLNPNVAKNTYALTYANGNLQVTGAGNNSNGGSGISTVAMSSGKWYAEFVFTSGTIVDPGFGIVNSIWNIGSLIDDYFWVTSYGYSYNADGKKGNNAASTAYGATYTTNDVIGVAFDADAGTLTFYKNGTSQGTAYSSIPAGSYQFAVYIYGNTSPVAYANFGQRPFAYTAPSGFKALCTQNLPTPTIGATTATQAGKFFNPVLYTGTGSSQSITGVGFQPDLVWTKIRSGAKDNNLTDAVRGTSKALFSNTTGAEVSGSWVTAFNSDGFTVGTEADANQSGQTFVGWSWKANGSGSSNTSGSITSTVSASTTSGFSVVTYTGTGANATVGHGLGVAPSMVIVKNRGSAVDWAVWHTSIANTQYLVLNTTAAVATGATWWNSTTPTLTVFSIGTSTSTNTSAATYVAYCFAPIAGYSAFGSYTGNGSTDGPFVFTGMRPAYVMVKRTDSTSDWYIWDTKRDTYNVVTNTLLADTSGAETSATSIDDLSNGFKCRSATVVNASGGTYIYMAFAEAPQKFSLAR